MRVLSSRKTRRRLVWLGGLGLVAGGVAALVVLVPSQKTPRVGTSSGSAQLVTHPRSVPLSAADRRAIAQTLDQFVPAAVRREKPGAAYDLVTPAMRQGMTRAQWASGQIPVYPYPARGTHFGGWSFVESYRNAVSFDLYLQPQPGQSDLGPIVAGVGLKRVHGRWLVDSFYPKQSFPPVEPAPAKATAKPASGSTSAPGATKGRLGALWFVLPGVLIGLFLAVLLAFVVAGWRRNRRAVRAYRANQAGGRSTANWSVISRPRERKR